MNTSHSRRSQACLWLQLSALCLTSEAGVQNIFQCVGETLAGLLVEGKLAACVNIVPGLTSVYWYVSSCQGVPIG